MSTQRRGSHTILARGRTIRARDHTIRTGGCTIRAAGLTIRMGVSVQTMESRCMHRVVDHVRVLISTQRGGRTIHAGVYIHTLEGRLHTPGG